MTDWRRLDTRIEDLSGEIEALARQDKGCERPIPGGSVRQGETPEVSVRRELAEEIGLVANAPLQLVGKVCGVWDGRIDRVFLFVLRLDRLPTLQLDNREIVGAQLVPIDDLHKVPLTGPVQAYVRGQFSPIDGGAAQSFS